MKICICTSKIRPDGVQTVFPPYGAMAIVQSLIKGGYPDTYLFDIDGLRPPYKDIIAQFQQQRPDVVGISGVVSTSYKFIKALITTLHEILPETIVIVGGNVAANSEILLRLAHADYCVIGEGELTGVALMEYLRTTRPRRSLPDDYGALRGIAGITFLDETNTVTFTGYRPNIPAEQLYGLDYDILERDTDINRYIIDPWFYPGFPQDPRCYEPHRKGKKLATLVSTKGCVAKCTFCHRWDVGIRFVPVDCIMERIAYVKRRYNVGFISFADENWGSFAKWNDEFLEKIARQDVLWRVGGVRARSVSLDLLRRMRATGCVNVQYGMESGSQRILDVMEKNAKVENNFNAAKWTFEAELYTSYALVMGMPGECPDTIRETTDFLKQVTVFLPEPPYARMSINRLEALPGTPVYEYGKTLGLIGRAPEEEEKYLLHISDTSGGEAGKQLNFTDSPDFIVQSWKRLMWLEVLHHWFTTHPEKQLSLPKTLWKLVKHFCIPQRLRTMRRYAVKDSSKGRDLVDTFVDKDWNQRNDEWDEAVIGLRYHTAFYFLRHFVVLEGVAKDLFHKDIPFSWWCARVGELVVYYCGLWKIFLKWRRGGFFKAYRSVRAIMKDVKPEPLTESERNLIPLQLGR
ncbi:MAG: B12-binding domain-containing radical SAM protein [Deltaproteobacteria bacterium]|nr:B12-binding domain-containing radical SAM protein [Deltaproteobacteria bacterium]